MDAVLNKLLWSMEYQEQLCMIDIAIREDHCEFGCNFPPLFFLARISGLMQYVAMRIKQFTPLPAYRPAWVGIAQPDVVQRNRV